MGIRGRGGVLAALLVLGAAVTAGAPAAGARSPWVPAPGLRWQFQLQGTVRTNLCTVPYGGGRCVRPQVYDIDLYGRDGRTPDSAAVAAIHATGGHAVCYVDAGTWEDWRPDAGRYPASVLGRSDGWPGERWVDIRATGVLLPILAGRVAACARAGFDAVDFDNVDGYTNDTGFSLTAPEQLTFDTDLAQLAHDQGLSVGLKNDLGQLAELRTVFDFAIDEQCAAFAECGAYASWTAAHKAVVEIEYHLRQARFCPQADAAGRDAVLKSTALRASPWKPCR